MFALLGPAFAHKCFLSPALQVHLWRVYTSAVVRSGLCALPLRHTHTQPITAFHRKILRGFLKLSDKSPVPAAYFLLAEIPIEGRIHLDTFSLFWSVWSNPQSTIYKIIKYLLTTSDNNSRTWSVHLRHLCRIYSMTDPLQLMEEAPWSKGRWKNYCTTMVTVYHEKQLREAATGNWKMDLFNVQMSSLRGKPHPILTGVDTVRQVMKLRPQIKMLCGDYLTYGTLAKQGDGSGHCRLCPGEWEDIRHILTECEATRVARDNVLPQLRDVLANVAPNVDYNDLAKDPKILSQFIVDCTSMNLPNESRINMSNSHMHEIFEITRDLCYCSHNLRMKALQTVKQVQ